MPQSNLWDELFGQVAKGAADIRHKLVEEPWFGRATTRGIGEIDREVAQDLGWVKPEIGGAEPVSAPERGHDFDR